MDINYSAQDYNNLKEKDKGKIKQAVLKEGKEAFKDYEARIKKLWPKEVKLPKAHWRHR